MTAPRSVITSFSPEGYEQYGRRFIETFVAHWPKTVRLCVYFEDGQELPDILPDNIRWFPVSDVRQLLPFLDAIRPFRLMSGDTTEGYNINWDARMGRKSFMLAHAVETMGGKVFWIDADVVTHADVPEGWLDEMLPDETFCCFLGRDHLSADGMLGSAGVTYTESGFLGINAQHELAAFFVNTLRDVFLSGAIFTQPGWHDCYAFDSIRRHGERQKPEAFRNLSAGVPGGPSAHVFINSRLGKYMDHMKGLRKRAGRSARKDLAAERPEPYWNR